MDYAKLRAMIDADPALSAMAEAGDDGGIAASLDAPSIAVQVQYQLTTLKVLDVLGPSRGTVVMKALRSLPDFSEIVPLMDRPEAGVNLNHPDADAMFAQLAAASILTADEGAALLALRESKTSPAAQALGGPITHLDVAQAMRSS